MDLQTLDVDLRALLPVALKVVAGTLVRFGMPSSKEMQSERQGAAVRAAVCALVSHAVHSARHVGHARRSHMWAESLKVKLNVCRMFHASRAWRLARSPGGTTRRTGPRPRHVHR